MAVVILASPKNLRPICKRQIGGDEQRRVLVKLADQMEQQLAAGLAERQQPSSSMTMTS